MTYEPEDDDELQIRPRTAPRRSRSRMGQVVSQMGARAVATGTGASLGKELMRRDQAARAKVLLEGGKNKGEEKGFGVTAGKVIDEKPHTAS